eukprot:s1195_g10.t1
MNRCIELEQHEMSCISCGFNHVYAFQGLARARLACSSKDSQDLGVVGNEKSPILQGSLGKMGQDDKTKAKEKDREYLYEVKWKELSPAENSYESVSRLEEGSRGESIHPWLKQLKALKLVQDLDDRIWTAWAGSQQRPLTDREILAHLEPFGLDEDVVCSRKISMLSSGQKCKLALGAAFWTRPHVVCLDEPTNYLDTETVELLKRAIRTFRGGCAAVSHSEKFVEEVCDEIWTVDEGRLKDQTQSITLLKNRFFWEEALRVFLLAGNAADVISFNAALSVCEWSRQWEQAGPLAAVSRVAKSPKCE